MKEEDEEDERRQDEDDRVAARAMQEEMEKVHVNDPKDRKYNNQYTCQILGNYDLKIEVIKTMCIDPCSPSVSK